MIFHIRSQTFHKFVCNLKLPYLMVVKTEITVYYTGKGGKFIQWIIYVCCNSSLMRKYNKTSFCVFVFAKVARIHFNAFLSLVDIFNRMYRPWIRQVHLTWKISLNMRFCKFSLQWCMLYCCPHFFRYNFTSSVNTTALDIYNTARRVRFFCRLFGHLYAFYCVYLKSLFYTAINAYFVVLYFVYHFSVKRWLLKFENFEILPL